VSSPAEAALAAAFRDEWPRLIAAGLRITGDLQAAEDVAQETLLAALDRWPLQGIPDRPGAWLMTVCRNRARNLVRDAGRAQQRVASLRPLLDGVPGEEAHVGEAPAGAAPEIADDQLRLIAMCCHPLLPADAQVALTLRMVAGLTTQEIARGFNAPVAVIAQRIVRAKRTLREHRVAFATDDPDIRDRLASVLDVIYLIFNEGYLPAESQALTRGDLAAEARRLACLVTVLMPAEPEPWALRALLSFQLSRWATRTGPDGELLTLDAQDRGQWDRELIADGTAALQRARSGPRGPLLLQAELAACHATAPSFAATDWAAIVALYDELLDVQDTPVVALNRAVAVAMAYGPAAALPALDQLAGDPVLAGSHRVWAVRADVNRRAGWPAAALADYDRALELVTNQGERRYLTHARRETEEAAMPTTFRKSPPELVARFDELAPLAGDADRKQMFGYPVCVLRGNMFMGLHQDSLILRLSEADRAEFLGRYDSGLFEPMPGRPMKEYVVVPPEMVYDDDAVAQWVHRSRAYAEQLPAKKPKQKKG
jgi:RNA polymerase sigma factor (sigma-70 family)